MPESVCSSFFWMPGSVPGVAGAGAGCGVSSIPERTSEKMSSAERSGPFTSNGGAAVPMARSISARRSS
jgi:hypothetical protein